MLLFKKERKKDVLKGRTIRYLTKEKVIACSEVHLTNVLNGRIPCSYLLAKNILDCVNPNATMNDFFVNIED